jgi:hypothetical protein
MTEATQQEGANPYNAKKTWHNIEEKPFTSSSSLYFEDPSERNKLFDSDNIHEITDETNVNSSELQSKKNEPYKKPDYKKRYDDLKKHYDNKLNQFKAREEELLTQVKQPEYVAPKTEEELEKFKTEYPDVYEVVETVAHLQSESKAKILEERLSKLQERENELIRQDAEKRLLDRHPDFEDIRNSDDFHDWAKQQHSSIQAWIYENNNDADLASRALDLFKRDIGIEPSKAKSSSKRQTRKSAADMVSTKTTSVEPSKEKIWSEKEIASMSMEEFDKYESEISEAMQQGRIVK